MDCVLLSRETACLQKGRGLGLLVVLVVQKQHLGGEEEGTGRPVGGLMVGSILPDLAELIATCCGVLFDANGRAF